MVPENIHTPPTEGHWKSRGGGGVQRQKFPRGVGVHRKLLFQRVRFWPSKLRKHVDRNAKFCNFDLYEISVDLICIFAFTENCVSPWPSVNIALFSILSVGTFFVKHQSCSNKYKNIFIAQSSKRFSAAFHQISSR